MYKVLGKGRDNAIAWVTVPCRASTIIKLKLMEKQEGLLVYILLWMYKVLDKGGTMQEEW